MPKWTQEQLRAYRAKQLEKKEKRQEHHIEVGKDELNKIKKEKSFKERMIEKQKAKIIAKENSWLIQYKGKVVSLNKYKSLHWTKLKKEIDPIKKEFALIIKSANIPRLDQVRLNVRSSTKYDIDNITGVSKIFVDEIVKAGILKDDSTKYFKELNIAFSPFLDFKGLEFEIFGVRSDINQNKPFFNPS